MAFDFSVDSRLDLLQEDRGESLLDLHQRKRKHETDENVHFFMIVTNTIVNSFRLSFCFDLTFTYRVKIYSNLSTLVHFSLVFSVFQLLKFIFLGSSIRTTTI